MKKIKSWCFRKLIIRIFAEVSTTTFANKEAGSITLFDAHQHYSDPTPAPEHWKQRINRRLYNVMVRLKNIWNWRTAWAVTYLCRELQQDEAFSQAWQSNIAMGIYDHSHGKLSVEECNRISDRLMDNLFGVGNPRSR